MNEITYPLNKITSLKELYLVEKVLPFSEDELIQLDNKVHQTGKLFLDPNIEKSLITKSEFLASYAISKAEESSITSSEAKKIEDLIDLSGYKLAEDLFGKKGVKPSKKAYEKLEFSNIVNTFCYIKTQPFSLSARNIKTIHYFLTQGLDYFKEYIPGKTCYHPGEWRSDNTIRVGNFAPPTTEKLASNVSALVDWYNQKPSINKVGLFHVGLYYLHPFRNGNKRVCRIFEYQLLRELGLDKNNFYSVSYYYHKEKERYYKYVTASLEKKNLGYFVAFFQEALAYSIIGVLKTVTEYQRRDFLNALEEKDVKKVLLPLISRKELQFKDLYRFNKRKVSRQTLVNYLQKAVSLSAVTRRELGRNVYYSLNTACEEEALYNKLFDQVKKKVKYAPNWLIP